MIENNENEILEEIVLETHDYEDIENISEKNKILQEKIKN